MAEGNRETRLRKLQCPFTWKNISENDLNSVKQDLHHDEAFVPLMSLTRYLIISYAQFLKQDYKLADEKIEEANKLISQFSNSEKEVVEHILEATKAHYLMIKENTDEVDEILKKINNIDDEKYLSTLNVFKAALWTHCNDFINTTEIAIEFAKLSLKYNPEYAISHYFLAKNLRTLRRLKSCHTSPDDEEMLHFETAYKLDKNPQYGLFLGQAYKEKRIEYQKKMMKDEEIMMKKKAKNILTEIHKMNIKCPSINLRLALYFEQNFLLNEAKECLDYVESVTPDDSMFLHYKGLYFMKMKNYEEAAEYLKKTYDLNNYGADIGYAQCMRILRKRFDFVEYFLKMIEKYENIEKCKQKEMHLHVAFTYFNIKRDIREAIKYFLQAFEIETFEFNMEKYFYPLEDVKANNKHTFGINVYKFLEDNIFPKITDYMKNNTIKIPEDVIAANEKLKKICEEYHQHNRHNL
ncbi:uncharacterized protein LOC127281509 isoform X2 [Leptopilina boulardi]|uniref:uncharacterized protein LOC127281509 isoform X2 n=1 Tax=Leptopilina boulardi TaxID=63433 RepID=UPI0021F578F6|nr:uncharacterized protein LOC127281509 isoform X2 [Leptopilina boulardi]